MKKCLIGTTFFILLLVANIPASSTTVPTTTSNPQIGGKTLYVGGLGPNNYTTIQEALNAASAGNTVFVYDDSSPYHENILISTSVSLIGEEKTTTIIDGMNHGNSINITADNVMVTGFTIENGNDSGVIINSNNDTITNNIISNNIYGIRTSFGQPFGATFSHNSITYNNIIDNGGGITFFSGSNNTIAYNLVSHAEQGIVIIGGSDNNISWNTVAQSGFGIWILSTYHTVIYRNNITHNSNVGVWTFITSADTILQNNFIGNNR
ncbi:MAG TPA: NosD domain-containing protein, partial [Candidatus Thermoplasmatota archaeon]|nr:NosD domain-containing protein [Candidatus Thermoplasmatota archaeon]